MKSRRRSIRKGCILVLSLLFLFSCGKKGAPVPKGFSPPLLVNDLKGEVRDGILFLSFSLPPIDPKAILGFKVSREESSDLSVAKKEWEIEFLSTGKFTIVGKTVFFFDDDLTPGKSYSYVVYLYDFNRKILGPSNTYRILWRKPPDKLDSVDVSIAEDHVRIKWKAEEGYMYNVYRYEKGKYSIFPLNPVPFFGDEYLDYGVPGDGDYVYEVRKLKHEGGVLLEGEGRPHTVSVLLKRKPKPPFSVNAELSDLGIRVSWDYPEDPKIHGFYVYRVSGGSVERLNKSPVFTRSFIDSSYPDAPYLLYHVRSVDEKGVESDESNSTVVFFGED